MLVLPFQKDNTDAITYAFRGDKVLIKSSTDKTLFPCFDELQKNNICPSLCFSLNDGHQVIHVCEMIEDVHLNGFEFKSIKPLYVFENGAIRKRLNHVYQWLHFVKFHQHCGQCGQKTSWHQTEQGKYCDTCQHVFYPRLNPAVMVLVTRGDEALLATSSMFKVPFYSALAGFVEIGETLEETAIREVKEEVNLDIQNIRYFGSQSWPFPSNLMIAMIADYAGGQIKEDKSEIEHAAWFNKDNLPQLPSEVSIAYQLITGWFKNQ